MYDLMDIAAIKNSMTDKQLKEYKYQKVILFAHTGDIEGSIHEACVRAFNIKA